MAPNWAPFTSHKEQAQGAFAETSKLRVTETFADTGVTEALVIRMRDFSPLNIIEPVKWRECKAAGGEKKIPMQGREEEEYLSNAADQKQKRAFVKP